MLRLCQCLATTSPLDPASDHQRLTGPSSRATGATLCRLCRARTCSNLSHPLNPPASEAAMSAGGDRPEHLWFLDTRVIVRIRHADGADGLSVLEHHACHGDSPPLHVHRDEDEV